MRAGIGRDGPKSEELGSSDCSLKTHYESWRRRSAAMGQ
jgi:hypothetical protein